jgi:hypothetical protein
VGLEKQAFMPLIFSQADLDVMAKARSAVDPSGRLNPAKVLPVASPHHTPGQRASMPAVPEGLWV